MKNYRHYLLIIGLLGIAFISLVVGVLISKSPNLTVNASAPNGKVEYEKNRQGRLLADEFITIENSVGGSENDDAVSVLSYGDKVFVFGNSSSLDYDLTDSDGRAFVAVLSRDLAIEDIKFLGDGEKIAHACISEGGFSVCFEDDGKIYLRRYSFDLQLRKSVRADNGGKFYFENMRYFGGKLYLVLRQSVSLTRFRLSFLIYDDALSLCYERIISSPYSLDLIDYFIVNDDITLFMNCFSDLGFRPAVARLNDGASVEVKYITDSANLVYSSVMPLPSGYLLSFAGDEDTGILSIDFDFAVISKQNLAKGKTSALGYGNGVYYFLSASDTNGCAIALSPDLNTVRTLDYLDGISQIYG
ncbi:MAG: hypothetical protein IKC64_03730, partial [Clostridia bacterium]|nr:hypothetical protein [Clostridia bacterium]